MTRRLKIGPAERERRLQAIKQHGINWDAGGASIGVSGAALRIWYRSEVTAGRIQEAEPEKPAVELPQFPDDDVGWREIVDFQKRRFAKRSAAHKARQWFPVKVNIEGPIGVLWFGDPHVDDNGCDWEMLDRHIEVARQPGVFGANIGDTTNNWSGRLSRLFANQDTSQSTARKLARGFLCESGITWLLWLMGNHDLWGDGSEILRLMNAQQVPMEDWQARFRLVFPNGREAKIHAAHNFAGHSMWNTLHGQQRAAHTKAEAHLYIAGHTHNWALHHEESASRDFTYWLARARGYKPLDSYAEGLGHFPQQEGAAILSVFDPEASSMTGFCQCFADPEEGAEFLAWKRQRKGLPREPRTDHDREGSRRGNVARGRNLRPRRLSA